MLVTSGSEREDFFCVYVASFKYEGGWENSKQLLLHNFREFSQPPECLDEAIQTQKKSFIAFIKYL